MQTLENNKVRLVDIAREVNVSAALVSKVLNGNSGSIRVSEEKAEMIRKTARKMNYTPNINARALAGQSTKVIGILIDSKAPTVSFRLLAEIEHEATLHGYRTLIGEAHDSVENLYETYQHLRQHGVDGVICISHDYPGENEKLEEYFRDCGPIVFLGQPEIRNHSHIILEIDSGIRDAVRYLRESGRKRIAMLADRNMAYYSSQDRIKGFLSILPDSREMLLSFTYHNNASTMREELRHIIKKFILPQQIDAILATNDITALILTGELNAAGLKIPEEIAVIGHDNEFFSECCPLPITTIDENNAVTAASSVKMLLDIMAENPKCRATRRITVKPELIIRKTT